MLNITPDLEQFSLGEPGGTVSMKATAKKPVAKKAPATKLAPVAAPKKCAVKKTTKKTAAPLQSGYPALDAGPSGPMLNFGFQDGPSGPMFQDGPSGPAL